MTNFEAPQFYPTIEDMMQPFEKYIESIESQMDGVGICKIIPPKDWCARRSGYDNLDEFLIPKPIQQHVTGCRGIFQAVHVEKRSMSLAAFVELSNLPANKPATRCNVNDHDSLEREFWKNITISPPLYGADGVGSLFDKDIKWNVGQLESILSRTLHPAGVCIPGVTTPYLYFGMWRSFFAWHTEDVDLYSVNYLHFGASKSWYTIPPAHRERFEALVRGLSPQMHKECNQFLRHKETLVTPHLLQSHNIPVTRVVQNAGEFVVNCPGVYHAGFNHGLNCAESTNFATKRWIPVGSKAKYCTCSPDVVKIDMALFAAKAEGEGRRREEEGGPSRAATERGLTESHNTRQAVSMDATLEQSAPLLLQIPLASPAPAVKSRKNAAVQEAPPVVHPVLLQIDDWLQCQLCLKWRIVSLQMTASLGICPDADFTCSMLPAGSCDTPEPTVDESTLLWDSGRDAVSHNLRSLGPLATKKDVRLLSSAEQQMWVAKLVKSRPGTFRLHGKLKQGKNQMVQRRRISSLKGRGKRRKQWRLAENCSQRLDGSDGQGTLPPDSRLADLECEGGFGSNGRILGNFCNETRKFDEGHRLVRLNAREERMKKRNSEQSKGDLVGSNKTAVVDGHLETNNVQVHLDA